MKDYPEQSGSSPSGDAAQPLKPNCTRKDRPSIDISLSVRGAKVDVRGTWCEVLQVG